MSTYSETLDLKLFTIWNLVLKTVLKYYGFVVELTSLLSVGNFLFNPEGTSTGECLRVSHQSIEYRIVSVKYQDHAARQQTAQDTTPQRIMNKVERMHKIVELLIGDRFPTTIAIRQRDTNSPTTSSTYLREYRITVPKSPYKKNG